MKKLFLLLVVLMVISLAACQKAAVVNENPAALADNAAVGLPSTGDAAVDSVADDLNGLDSVEEDLDIGELDDLDSGLDAIENI